MKNIKQPRTKPNQRPRAKVKAVKGYTYPMFFERPNPMDFRLYPASKKWPRDVRVTVVLGHIGKDFTISPLPRSRK